MYEEDKYSINWFKIALRLVIILLVLLLSIKLITVVLGNKTNVKETDIMHDALKSMDVVARDYFQGDKLPKEVGESDEITLEELINKKLIQDIIDEDGNKCDVKKSTIKVIRLDEKYQIKSTLKCDSFDDYLNSFIKIENQTVKVDGTKTTTTAITKKTTNKVIKETSKIKTTNVTTQKEVVKTTKKTTTVVKKKYTVSFNTNGGDILDSIIVVEGNKIGSVVPVRSGYRFIGWYYHGNAFDMNSSINQNYVLTAKWVKE